MTKKTRDRLWAFIAISLISIAISIPVVWLMYILTAPDSDPCIPNTPREVVSGDIRSVGGPFSAETAYWLTYKGTRKVSGEACVVSQRTTVAEYERQIYGRDSREFCGDDK